MNVEKILPVEWTYFSELNHLKYLQLSLLNAKFKKWFCSNCSTIKILYYHSLPDLGYFTRFTTLQLGCFPVSLLHKDIFWMAQANINLLVKWIIIHCTTKSEYSTVNGTWCWLISTQTNQECGSFQNLRIPMRWNILKLLQWYYSYINWVFIRWVNVAVLYL